MRTNALIDPQLIDLLDSGITVANAEMLMTTASQGQIAIAITGGYRGRVPWPAGLGSGSDRNGLYVATNYNYLRGLQYQDMDLSVRLDTDADGLITLTPLTDPIVINRREASDGAGFSVDVGVGAVFDHIELGFGARGLANRINWRNLTETRYSLANLLSGDDDFIDTPLGRPANTRVDLPVDYRGSVAYSTDEWTVVSEVHHGLGRNSLRAGVERRFARMEVGAARGTRYRNGAPQRASA